MLAHEQVIGSGDHQASARAVCVLQLVSMADRRTERLCVLLPVSISCCIVFSCREVECLPSSANCSIVLSLAVWLVCTCMYLIQLSLIYVHGLSNKINATFG